MDYKKEDKSFYLQNNEKGNKSCLIYTSNTVMANKK